MSTEAVTDLDLDLSDLRPRKLPDLDWDLVEDTRPYSVPALLAVVEVARLEVDDGR